MAQCPVCQAEIHEDFGLVTCPSCGSSVLIDFEGAAAEPPSEAPPMDQSLPDEAPPIEPPPFEDAFDAGLVPEEPVSPTPAPMAPASPDMGEIAAFGNSDVSQGNEGNLRFNLYVMGLDSSDVRQELRAAIDDQKFRWNTDDVMAQIVNGELRLESLSAVKCSLLVQRLRSIPIEVRWEQYAIQQP